MRGSHASSLYIHYNLGLFTKLLNHILKDPFLSTSLKLTRSQRHKSMHFILETETPTDPHRNKNSGGGKCAQQGPKSGASDGFHPF